MPLPATSIDDIAEYTTQQIAGTGAFDILMNAITQHLDVQYNKSRITGPDYAKVYLGAIEAALKFGLDYILGKEIADQTVCKLAAEYDVLILTKDKVIAETNLLVQKTVTELAQVNAAGVSAESVIGKQMTLYQRQADGFLRDAEQKAAKQLIDTWNVRRTTDNGTVADGTNKLNDVTIGAAVTKLLAGVGI